MTRVLALLLGVFAAVAAWVIAPIVQPDLAQVWFVGAGDFQGVLVHGRDVAAAAAGLVVWIAALHVPRRGKVIAGIRIGATGHSESLAAAGA
jgi:hypothetical protein